MKILIATGIYPPDVGGPAKYAEGLAEALKKLGNDVKVLPYKIEKKLPWGIRHIVYLFRAIFNLKGRDFVIALDTVSVGFPSCIASFLMGKKIAIRTGGDFLWESYVERTGLKVPLPDFYEAMPVLSPKERIIIKVHQFVLDYADFFVFSTNWQKDIWTSFYNVNLEKIKIIENCYYEKKEGVVSSVKNFLGAGRHISVKNLDYLSQAFEEVKKEVSDIELDIGIYSPQDYEERLKSCYAVVSVSLSEISPNSIIEAIAYNKPFIITKYNGISERLNGAGIKIDPNNLNDIKKAIISISQDRKYKIEVNKVKKINLVRSYENIAEEFINLFSKNV